MAFCLILWKMLKIKLALSRLKRVKVNAYRRSKNLPPIYQWYIRILLLLYRLLKFIFFRIFCFCLSYRFKNGPSAWEILFKDGTLPNKVLKSIVGLIVGIILTNCWIVFSVNQLNFDPVKTTWFSMLIGSFLIFGLAFSETIRCYWFLVVPQFFTKKGRYALLCYCLTLALSGPAKNTTINMEILTESLVCGQDMAFNATRDLRELVQSPKAALGKVFQGISDAIKEATKAIRGSLRALIDIIKYIVNIIKSAYYYLKDIASTCNEEYGSLYDRCTLKFEEAYADCEYQLDFLPWNLNSAICSSVNFLQNLCHVSKVAEVLCWLPSLIKDVILNPVLEFFENLWEKIKLALFDIKIKKHYKFEHSINSTKSFKDIAREMHQDIMGRVQWMLDYIDIINLLVSLFMFTAFYKAYMYRRRFLKLDRHDNIYITKTMVQIDIQRRKVGKESAFPIKYRESNKYIQSSSLVLTKEEKKLLKFQLMIVGISIVKILSYVVIDYVFYQFLLLLRKHGAIVIDTRKIIGFDVQVKGDGFLADMYRFILRALAPIGELMPIFDTTPCLPSPSIPNYYRYCLIFFILFVVLLATVLEPYGLRLRHIICEIYYPERKVPRARWLYTHILTTRQTFMEFAASYLKAKVTKKNPEIYHISCLDRLSHKIPGMRKFLYLIGYRKKKCFLCGKSGDEDDRENYVDCLKCFTVYCNDCYEDLGNVCVVCESPVEYNELSSNESGSPSDMEEEEEYAKLINNTLKRRVVELAAPELKNLGKIVDTSFESSESAESGIGSPVSGPISTSSSESSESETEKGSQPTSVQPSSETTSNSEEEHSNENYITSYESSSKSGKEQSSEKYMKNPTHESSEDQSSESYMKTSSYESSEKSYETGSNKPATKSKTSASSMVKSLSTGDSEESILEVTSEEDESSGSDEEKKSLLRTNNSDTKRKANLLNKVTKYFKFSSPKVGKLPKKKEQYRSRAGFGSSSKQNTTETDSSSVEKTITEAEAEYDSSSTEIETMNEFTPLETQPQPASRTRSETPLKMKTQHSSTSVQESSLLKSIKGRLEHFSTLRDKRGGEKDLTEVKRKLSSSNSQNRSTTALTPFEFWGLQGSKFSKQKSSSSRTPSRPFRQDEPNSKRKVIASPSPSPVVGTHPRFETYNKFQAVLSELHTKNFVSPETHEIPKLRPSEADFEASPNYEEEDLLTLDQLDSQDEFGNYHCHHHEPEDEATIQKYSDVISELSANFDANSGRDMEDFEDFELTQGSSSDKDKADSDDVSSPSE